MEDIEPTINDLIHYANDRQPIEFGDAFEHLIKTRIADAVEARKVELASSLYKD